MKCPNDETVLVMSDRQGIEIDYCPQCRGVWLDRGELDKIIERSNNVSTSNTQNEEYDRKPQQYQDQRPRDEYNKHSDPKYYKKRKKESFLSDLFDF